MSKAKALEAVRVFAPGEVHRLAKLKKAQIAAETERLAAGSGWLPVMFRQQEAAAIEPVEASPDGDADADAEAGADADGTALDVEEEGHATA